MAAVTPEDQYKNALANIHTLAQRLRRVVSGGMSVHVEQALSAGLFNILRLCELSGAVPLVGPEEGLAGRDRCAHPQHLLGKNNMTRMQVCLGCGWRRTFSDAAVERDRWFPPAPE